MLDAYGEQAFRGPLERFAALVPRSHRDPRRPGDLVVVPGHGQAAFLALRLALGRDDFRIDEDEEVVLGIGDVDDDDALVHVDLRGGEADAGGRVHGFRHVAHELDDLRR